MLNSPAGGSTYALRAPESNASAATHALSTGDTIFTTNEKIIGTLTNIPSGGILDFVDASLGSALEDGEMLYHEPTGDSLVSHSVPHRDVFANRRFERSGMRQDSCIENIPTSVIHIFALPCTWKLSSGKILRDRHHWTSPASCGSEANNSVCLFRRPLCVSKQTKCAPGKIRRASGAVNQLRQKQYAIFTPRVHGRWHRFGNIRIWPPGSWWDANAPVPRHDPNSFFHKC